MINLVQTTSAPDKKKLRKEYAKQMGVDEKDIDIEINYKTKEIKIIWNVD